MNFSPEDSNSFRNVGIHNLNNELIVMNINASSDNISLHSSSNDKNVDILSIRTLLNKDQNKELHLSAYDGNTINPIIQINNTHQHVNITSNLNVASNLNCNNIKIDTLPNLITNGTIANNITSDNYNTVNNLLTVIKGLNSRINYLYSNLYDLPVYNDNWKRTMYPAIEKSPSFHLQLFYTTVNVSSSGVNNVFLCTQNNEGRFLRLNIPTTLYSDTTKEDNTFVFHFEKDVNGRIYLCQYNFNNTSNSDSTNTETIASFMTNRIFTFDRRALFLQNSGDLNSSNYADTMAFDELKIKYEYISYANHTNIESFESGRHASNHDDRIVCILKINIGEEQISTDQSENTRLTGWYTSANTHSAPDSTSNIINAKAGPSMNFRKAYIQTELYSSGGEGKIFIGGHGGPAYGDVNYPHENGGAFRLHVFDNNNNNKSKLLDFINSASNSSTRWPAFTPLSLANIVNFS